MTRYPPGWGGGRAWQRHVRRKIVPCCWATSLATGECQRCHSRKCLRMNQRACRRQTKGPWEPCAFCFLPATRGTSFSNVRSIYSNWSLSPTTHFTRSHGLWKFHFDARARININKKKAGWSLFFFLCNSLHRTRGVRVSLLTSVPLTMQFIHPRKRAHFIFLSTSAILLKSKVRTEQDNLNRIAWA